MNTADVVISRLARAQHGVVTRAQLLAAGVGKNAIERRLKMGVLHRVAAGAYVVEAVPPSFRQRLTVATFATHGAVASHESAAQLHRWSYVPRGLVVVTVPRVRRVVRVGDRLHRYADLRDEFCTDVDGIRTTTPERTMLDLAAGLRSGRLERVLDDQLASGRLELAKVIDVFNACARRGRHGCGRLRPLLEMRGDGWVVPASELEARFLALLQRHDLPAPQRQFLPPWAVDDGIGRVDFAYADAKLIIEVDGRRWHSRDQATELDAYRDQQASSRGWRHIRFTWRQVTRDQAWVATVVSGCLSVAA